MTSVELLQLCTEIISDSVLSTDEACRLVVNPPPSRPIESLLSDCLPRAITC